MFLPKNSFGEEDFNFCKRLKINNIKVETILSATIYHKVSSSINKTNNTKKKIAIDTYYTSQIE